MRKMVRYKYGTLRKLSDCFFDVGLIAIEMTGSGMNMDS
jgi:hypothetical protein